MLTKINGKWAGAGAILVLLSFSREVLSITADVLQVLTTIQTTPIATSIITSPIFRLLLLVGGLAFILISTRTSERKAVDQTHRALIKSTLSSVFEEGETALRSIPEKLIDGRVNHKLWLIALSHYYNEWRENEASFDRWDNGHDATFREHTVQAYRTILEMASVGRMVHRDRDLTPALRLWTRRLETLEPEVRRWIGDSEVTKARSLAFRNLPRPFGHDEES